MGLLLLLRWKIGGKVNYVLEGNLNYTGAVITWLKDDLQIISSPGETGKLAKEAIQEDSLYLVPAFSGLGAPYWDSEARASVVGMSRTTRKAEFVRAALECIAYQITDVVQAMSEDAGVPVKELRVDGGPTPKRLSDAVPEQYCRCRSSGSGFRGAFRYRTGLCGRIAAWCLG